MPDTPDEADTPDEERVQRRAESLLPEEQQVGSDDAAVQAEQILAESDARSLAPRPVEQRRSEDTVEPVD